jgi:hypothetical protein
MLPNKGTEMFKILSQSLIVFLLMMSQTFAQTIEQQRIDFPIKADELLKGEIHYYYSILTPQKLAVQHADLLELDSLSLKKKKDVMMVLNKSVYIVKKPVGFFDDKQLSDERYVSYIFGQQKVKKLAPESYEVSVPGEEHLTYKIQMFFDADDVSTLPNSKIIRGVNAVKKLDVISKGASTIMFTEKTHFSKYSEGGISASSFIPLNEKNTLIITYNLYAVHKVAIDEKAMKQSFLAETNAVKKLQTSFK